MFCYKCGKEIADNSESCEHCGAKLKETNKRESNTKLLISIFTRFIVNGGTVTKAILDISRDVWRKNVKPA